MVSRWLILTKLYIYAHKIGFRFSVAKSSNRGIMQPMTLGVILDAGLVGRLMAQKGLKRSWVCSQMGLGQSAGYMMLRDGLLPKDNEVRTRAVEKLAEVLGVGVGDLLLHLEANRTA